MAEVFGSSQLIEAQTKFGNLRETRAEAEPGEAVVMET